MKLGSLIKMINSSLKQINMNIVFYFLATMSFFLMLFGLAEGGTEGLFIFTLGLGLIAADIYIVLFADVFIGKCNNDDILDRFDDEV
jgi:hypothetical protein